jgi:hypothetical protein
MRRSRYLRAWCRCPRAMSYGDNSMVIATSTVSHLTATPRRSLPPASASTTGTGLACPSLCVPAKGWRRRERRWSWCFGPHLIRCFATSRRIGSGTTIWLRGIRTRPPRRAGASSRIGRRRSGDAVPSRVPDYAENQRRTAIAIACLPGHPLDPRDDCMDGAFVKGPGA